MTDTTGHAELIAHLLRSFENKTLVHWARGKEAADALAAAKARIAELEEDYSRLTAFTEKRWSDTRLLSAGPSDRGGFEFLMGTPFGSILGEFMMRGLTESGGENYVVLGARHPDVGELEFSIQKVRGKTPAQKLAECQSALAQARKDALEEAAAAVDRWAGIEPPSQSSFGAAIRALITKGETG